MTLTFAGTGITCLMVAASACLAICERTASAAETVTPESPSYVEKMTEEQIAVAMAESQSEKASLCLRFSCERVREMEELARSGRFRFIESVAAAFEVLARDGVLKAARHGVSLREDMREAFSNAAAALGRCSREIGRLASAGGLPGDSAAAMARAADCALSCAAEAEADREREMARVAGRERLFASLHSALKTALREGGSSEDEAEALCALVMNRCMRHDTVRIRTVTEILRFSGPGGPETAAELAAQCNSLCEWGFAESDVIQAARGLSASGGHAKAASAMKEAMEAARAGDGDRKEICERMMKIVMAGQARNLDAAALRNVFRHARRAMKQGVPAGVVLDIARRKIEAMEKIDGSLEDQARRIAGILEDIMQSMREKALEYQERARNQREDANGRKTERDTAKKGGK